MAPYVAAPPSYVEILSRSTDPLALLRAGSEQAPPGYPPWEKVRHLKPPAGLTTEEWWAGIKLARIPALRDLPLHDTSGSPFRYGLPDTVLRLLHAIDQRCSGEVAMDDVVTTDGQAMQRYLVNSLMEEAIRSSQLEGAVTSQRVAKELLRSGRQPRDRSERMILNNFNALTFMREQVEEPLTPSLVLELQRLLTEGTLDEPETAGRLQRPEEERVVVMNRDDGRVLHVPPPADQLPARLEAMCTFANQPDDGDRFLHPVVRAILLHFWLAYDHPFVDGNGRTARALFYWCMRRRRYWLVEYLSISRILHDAPGRYNRSYLHSESDDNDTTYFLLYQLEVIERAIREFHAYLHHKTEQIRTVEQLIADAPDFNHRQLALLGDALRHPDRQYTIGAHATTHRVTHETARADLAELAERALLHRTRTGKPHRFTVPRDLERRLRETE